MTRIFTNQKNGIRRLITTLFTFLCHRWTQMQPRNRYVWPLRTAPSKHALRAPAFEAGRPAVVSAWANAFATHRPPCTCMTAWICELEAFYSLNVNRKGYLSFYALTRLRMHHQPFATARPIRLVVIASEARQSSIVQHLNGGRSASKSIRPAPADFD